MTAARLRIVLPVLVLLSAAAGAWLLAEGAAPESAARDEPVPVVKVLRVQPQRLRLPVRSQGVLQPAREIDLTAEVQGRVEALHDGFVVGGRFKAGEVLVRVAAHEYRLAVVRAETQLAEARRKLAEEQAAAQQAQREWKVLGQGAPTPLSLHQPQVQEAKAGLKQAEAELADAGMRLSRCEIRAPFSGRVKEKLTGVGQMAETGKTLGRIYADDAAEVRLPLSQAQIGYLAEPTAGKAGLKVVLTAERGAETVRREAAIVRREGIVDQHTGLEYWVARLNNPERAPALLPGTFLTAEIEGRELDGVFELPRGALNAAQEAVLVEAGNKLQIRRLAVLRSDADRVWIGGGLQAGERVVVAGIETPVAGRQVVAEAADNRL
ncbi:efflux RND transporter periplasmic adaptor subunit [Candidatus Methylomicrobium oryzae]|uniref:efflux RND transporter periplasmic adaptor subunit n=1 Tax=Candidatus Methylomicrobium oryzae TaxID=2802053 RepID=UPI0019227589|nr:efflux RND transporter periplasmic adaptor subunit [Methylomicrobium sp. RS1]MBL1266034.1 efflux RND transporter periplasmic adaptor subunit [Methylomicrobium sp. RS1]